jgi:type IV secretion system protein VirB9
MSLDQLMAFTVNPDHARQEQVWEALQRVFDDGAKVYIQFPSGLAQSEAPPLFVIGPDAKPALVNYRVRGTTYIVDRLFAAAELRLGTAPQRVVRIVRTDAVWRETTP